MGTYILFANRKQIQTLAKLSINFVSFCSFRCVVANTSAQHSEGLRFDPGRKHHQYYSLTKNPYKSPLCI